MDSKLKFFSYDGDNMTFHETEKMAREAAEQDLADYSEWDDDDAGWVCWGRLVQASRETVGGGSVSYDLEDVT
jgi:hypothetical protein